MTEAASTRRRFAVRVLFGGLGFATAAFGVHRLLHAAKRRAPALLRPPGARSEAEFLARCIRCGQCVEACPEQQLLERRSFEESLDPEAPAPRSYVGRPLRLAGLTMGVSVGTPYCVPRDCSCNLCAGQEREELRCVAVCPTEALRAPADLRDIDMGLAVVDHGTCFGGTMCKACWHACPYPNEALKHDMFGRIEIDPEHCIGCGLCEYACLTEPTSIRIEPKGPGASPGE